MGAHREPAYDQGAHRSPRLGSRDVFRAVSENKHWARSGRRAGYRLRARAAIRLRPARIEQATPAFREAASALDRAAAVLALDDERAPARRLIVAAWLPHPCKEEQRRTDHSYPCGALPRRCRRYR